MSYSEDLKLQLTTAIAKAGVQQHNSIIYLLKANSHKKFKHLQRLEKFEKFLDCKTAKNILNAL